MDPVVAVQSLRERTHLPVVAIEPAIKPAVSLTRSGVVGVLATQQTVQSASVARLCALHGADTRILLQAAEGGPWPERLDKLNNVALRGAH